MRLVYEQLTDIPVGFTEVEYLESTDRNCYIDTQVFPIMDSIKIEIRASKETGYSLFGSYDSGKQFNLTGSGNNNYLRYASSATNAYQAVNPTQPHLFIADKGTLYVDGEQKGQTVTTITGTSLNSVALYARLSGTYNNQYTDAGNHKIYYCKIWNGGSLVRDFVPCLDTSNVPCMYDKVEGKAYYNQGTGTFGYGREIHLVEYIETDGNQFLNSYIHINNTDTLTATLDIQYKQNNTRQLQGYGVRDGYFGCNASNYYEIAAAGSTVLVGNRDTVIYEKTISDDTKYHKLYVNGNILATVSREMSVSEDGDLRIFQTSTLTNMRTYAKLYHYNIVLNGVLVRDYYPAIDENGVGFLFDNVSHSICDNGTSTNFICGKVLKKKKLRLVYDSTRHLPKGYREVEYLESTGTQYIKTGISDWNNTIEYELKLGIRGQASGIHTYFGSWTSWTSSGKSFPGTGTYTSYRTQTSFTAGGPASGGSNIGITVGQNGILSLKGNKVSWSEGSSVEFDRGSDFTANRELILYGCNGGGTIGELSSFPIYYAKFWMNGELIRNFYPVKDENGVGYLFDTVTETLYGNDGSGSFTVGPDIITKDTIRFIEDGIPSIYRQVNYLQSTGYQYIDTGIVGKSGLKTNMGIEWGQEDIGQDRYVLGAADTYYGRCYFGIYQSKWMYGYSQYYQAGTPVADTYYNCEVSWELGNQYMKINGETLYSGNNNAPLNVVNNWTLFARNQGGVSWYSHSKIYFCKIWENGIIIRNYIPVVRKSDNKPGMYDRITKQFYVNNRDGVEDFNYG